MDRPQFLELRCRHCGWSEICGPGEINWWLRRAGKLRPGQAPDLPVLYALFRSLAPDWKCPECDQPGLIVQSPSDERAGWPGPVPCACCSRPIPPERLAAIPGTTRCAACQQAGERGRPPEEADHCPRCGAPMIVRVVLAGRSTRYVLGCSGTPPCPL